ncbi:cold-shock protein [Pseudoduganella sp. OTU4001]|uniref:cold-shock protein n=1 Tax=Pseudoduganella sp. OTU4001 TaxID=3043854 RepID=UPI00313C3101
MSMHTGTVHWFSRLKGIGQIRPDAGGYDVSADIGDFVGQQQAGSLEEKLVSYDLDESAYGMRAINIHVVQRL